MDIVINSYIPALPQNKLLHATMITIKLDAQAENRRGSLSSRYSPNKRLFLFSTLALFNLGVIAWALLQSWPSSQLLTRLAIALPCLNFLIYALSSHPHLNINPHIDHFVLSGNFNEYSYKITGTGIEEITGNYSKEFPFTQYKSFKNLGQETILIFTNGVIYLPHWQVNKVTLNEFLSNIRSM